MNLMNLSSTLKMGVVWELMLMVALDMVKFLVLAFQPKFGRKENQAVW